MTGALEGPDLSERQLPIPYPGNSRVEQWIENHRIGGSIPPLGHQFIQKNKCLREFCSAATIAGQFRAKSLGW